MNEDNFSPASNEENIFAPANTPAPAEPTPVVEPATDNAATAPETTESLAPAEPITETAEPVAEPTATVTEPVAAEPVAAEPVTTEAAEPAATETAEPAVSEQNAAPVSPFASPSVPDASTSTTVAQPVKKKSKAPLILGIIFLLLLIGGGAFFLFAQKLISDAKPQDTEPVADVEDEPETKEDDKLASLRLSDEKLSNFDLSLLKAAAKDESKTTNADKNVVYSPLSIKYALAMLNEGADGETKTQIQDIIGDYQAKAYINSENRSLANALFIRDNYQENIIEDYITTLKDKYAADVITDSFANANNINQWISDQTLGIIKNAVGDDFASNIDYALINALAIDMEWENALQCSSGSKAHSIYYNANYEHETYTHSVKCIDGETGFSKEKFNEKDTRIAAIGASVNNYDLITELGEDKVKETIEEAYGKWLDEPYIEGKTNREHEEENDGVSPKEAVSKKFIEELKANYKSAQSSTDFMMEDTDDIIAFAKDLKEYDGATLQYVAVMPKNQELSEYIKDLKAEDFSKIIDGLKELKGDDFEDGYLTQIDGYVPFFKYNYKQDLVESLKEMGITDIFDKDKADLSKLTSAEDARIDFMEHMAEIELSNDGIKAAAVTMGGGLGDSNGDFQYNFEIPEEKIKKIELNFDKPFIYIVRDKNTGEVWFTGATYEGKTE